jgi:hypothetical protein
VRDFRVENLSVRLVIITVNIGIHKRGEEGTVEIQRDENQRIRDSSHRLYCERDACS